MKFLSSILYTLSLLMLAACSESISTQAIADEQMTLVDLAEAIKSNRFKQITSVVVSRNNDVIYEDYWNDGGPGNLNDTRSATKTLVAMAIGAAIDDGHIASSDSNAFDWFEAERPFRFNTELKGDITVRDLLTMSSALDCNDNVWESPGNEEHMYPARNWTYFVLDMPTRLDYERDEAGYGSFSYCTAGSFILGQIVERASGEPIDQYIERRLLKPLGVADVHWDRSPSAEVMTGGGTELTSRDLLSLGELLLNNGKHEGQQVLSAKWVATMLRVHRTANEQQDYGLQIWREDFTCRDAKVETWYMGGNGGNKVAIIPELNVVAVVTATLYGTSGMHQQSTDIIEQYVLPTFAECSSS